MACPHCQASARMRIDSPYELLGVVIPDGYCGRCGWRWPTPVVRPVPPRDEDPDPPGLEIEP